MTSTNINTLKTWRNGADGFFQFLEDVEPRVPSSKGGYEIYVPGDQEKEEIRKAIDGDYRTIVFCWPRRHGKTLASALIIVWRFLTRQTQSIGIIANSARQTVDTAFRTVRAILEQTPYTSSLIQSKKIIIQRDNIKYAALALLRRFGTENAITH